MTDQFASLRRFCELRDKIAAEPRVIVGYEREAWLTPDGNSARLTFDRGVIGGPYCQSFTVQPTADWVTPNVGGVVLELKFTDRFPNWMRDMIQVFNLQRCSMAKYVKCANSLARRATASTSLAAAAAAMNAPVPTRAPALSRPIAPAAMPGFVPVARWA
jgi:hypothetical protein